MPHLGFLGLQKYLSSRPRRRFEAPARLKDDEAGRAQEGEEDEAGE